MRLRYLNETRMSNSRFRPSGPMARHCVNTSKHNVVFSLLRPTRRSALQRTGILGHNCLTANTLFSALPPAICVVGHAIHMQIQPRMALR